jgi:imidazolonepropionase-like amidohydrolase
MMKTNKSYTRQRVYRVVSLVILSAILISTWTSGCNQNPGQTIAFTNVNLIPMTSETVIENQTVLVSGSDIIDIGPADELEIPRGAQVIDGKGAYLMPGLADMHAHTRISTGQWAQPWEDPKIWPVHPLNLYLANGVTTIRDLNAQDEPGTYPRQLQEDIRAGRRVGPTIYTSGEKLDGSPLEDPEGLVRQNHERGYDLLKLYSFLSVDDFQAVMREAKKLGLYTAGHIPYSVGLEGVLSAGMDEIAHVEELDWEFFEFDRSRQLQPDEWFPILIQAVLQELDLSSSNYFTDFESENQLKLEKIANQLRTAGVSVCTTVNIAEIMWLKQFHPDAFLARPENRFLDPKYLETVRQGKEYQQSECRGIEDICAIKYDFDRWILRGLHAVGVQLLLGTDALGGIGIVPGFSVHDELRILVENGFTPYEAIQTGTVNAAKVVERMTGEGDFGTIEIGKRADLILVSENPLEDITTIREPLGVMAAGKWFSAEQLSELIEISGSTK